MNKQEYAGLKQELYRRYLEATGLTKIVEFIPIHKSIAQISFEDLYDRLGDDENLWVDAFIKLEEAQELGR